MMMMMKIMQTILMTIVDHTDNIDDDNTDTVDGNNTYYVDDYILLT